MVDLTELTATEAAGQIAQGALTAEALTGEDRLGLDGNVAYMLSKRGLGQEEWLGQLRELVSSASRG